MLRALLLPLLVAGALDAAAARPARDAPTGCDYSVIGGGPGGVYFAWRLARKYPELGPSICLFERSHRLGGRVLSLTNQGPQHDLTVELGAYRFNSAPMYEKTVGAIATPPEQLSLEDDYTYVYTPVTSGVVKGALGLATAPYDPGEANSTMEKIVGPDGRAIGYLTFVERMMEEAAALGVRLFYGHKLTGIEVQNATARGRAVSFARVEDSVRFALRFEIATNASAPDERVCARATTAAVGASVLFLNTPWVPLLDILKHSPTLFETQRAYPRVLQTFYNDVASKLYVYYEDAWWRNYLNLTAGEFLIGQPVQQTPVLSGRYYDGDFRCDGAALSDGSPKCRGYLEATYAYGDKARWFQGQELNTDPPATFLDYTTPSHAFLLDQVHEQLVEYHRAALERAGKAEQVAQERPVSGWLSFWSTVDPGFGGGVHGVKNGSISDGDASRGSIKPFANLPIFLANEAYGSMHQEDGSIGGEHGWAECALSMAENGLYQYFDVGVPPWVDPEVYAKFVLYN